jgi:serine/threonine protein phosphatase PrpC
MFKVYLFSRAKNKRRNEDFCAFNKKSFVVADGSTDKSGIRFKGKTGGEIASRLVVKEVLACQLNGKELVDHLNRKLKEFYKRMNVSKQAKIPKNRFSCSFVSARIIRNKLIITYLGDLGFRINIFMFIERRRGLI